MNQRRQTSFEAAPYVNNTRQALSHILVHITALHRLCLSDACTLSTAVPSAGNPSTPSLFQILPSGAAQSSAVCGETQELFFLIITF